jgi:membrane protein implicated in regulation of membrane protease activity
MNPLAGATVNTLYVVLLILGLIYALFLLFSGQLGGDADLGDGAGDFDVDAGPDLDAGAGDHALGAEGHPGISPISPLTIAIFITAFGASGLIARGLFLISERFSLVWAALGGVFATALVYVGFTYLFIKPQGSSEVRVAELAGLEAEVITPVPENGLGEIAVVAQGGRVTYAARAKGGAAIARSQVVRITRIVGGVAYVEPTKEE